MFTEYLRTISYKEGQERISYLPNHVPVSVLDHGRSRNEPLDATHRQRR